MKAMLVIALTAIVVGSSSATEKKQGQCEVSGTPKNACSLSSLVVKTGVTLDKSNCNQKFTMQQLAPQPLVQWSDADPNKEYTFLILSHNPVTHWGVGNIPGSALKEVGNLTGYKQLTYHKSLIAKDFQGPETYLYQYLLYEQTEINRDYINDGHKKDFNLTIYAHRNNLCGPVAGLQAWISEESTKSSENQNPSV